MKKRIPGFKSPEEEALFWESHKILDYIDPKEFKVVYPWKSRKYRFVNPGKRLPKRLISIRVDIPIIEKAKKEAVRRKVAYQSVLRRWLEKASSAA